MEFYQWLVPLLAIYYSVKIFRQYAKKQRLIRSTVIWLSFWIIISFLAVVPHDTSVSLANILGFKDNINAVIFIALAVLFLFNMFFTATIEKLEKQMTEVVRKLAIENQTLRADLSEYEKELIQRKVENTPTDKSKTQD